MTTKTATHQRKKNVIKAVDGTYKQNFESINAAKRASRELQKKGAVMQVIT